MVSSPLLALLALSVGAPATPLALCRQWREERESLSSRAMAAELQLVHETRLRLCPALERQAAAANANEPEYSADVAAGGSESGTSIDYQALLDCRHRAESWLRTQRPVLHRNRRGFLFYTAAGAELARRADAMQQHASEGGCP